MNGYGWMDELPPSLLGNDSLGIIHERSPRNLLRPIFINAVEVGYVYIPSFDGSKRLRVRGIIIALWFFISRGHQVQALLPFCFKTYPHKSDFYDELMTLYRMNLIEFTPGFGTDKYVEVNRMICHRAKDFGGCMVARSQMYTVIAERPSFAKLVEKRLLIPSFNGNNLLFSADGPYPKGASKGGKTLTETTICRIDDPDWPLCATQQLTLQDQRLWTRKLASLIPNMDHWVYLAEQLQIFRPMETYVAPDSGYPHVEKSSFQIRPPETNPKENRGFSRLRRMGARGRPYDGGRYRAADWNSRNQYYRRGNYGTNHYPGTDNMNRKSGPIEKKKQESNEDGIIGFIGHPNSIYKLVDPAKHIKANGECSCKKRTIDDAEIAPNPDKPSTSPVPPRMFLTPCAEESDKSLQTVHEQSHNQNEHHPGAEHISHHEMRESYAQRNENNGFMQRNETCNYSQSGNVNNNHGLPSQTARYGNSASACFGRRYRGNRHGHLVEPNGFGKISQGCNYRQVKLTNGFGRPIWEDSFMKPEVPSYGAIIQGSKKGLRNEASGFTHRRGPSESKFKLEEDHFEEKSQVKKLDSEAEQCIYEDDPWAVDPETYESPSSLYIGSLAERFGWSRAKAVCDSNPEIDSLLALEQILLEEENRGKKPPQEVKKNENKPYEIDRNGYNQAWSGEKVDPFEAAASQHDSKQELNLGKSIPNEEYDSTNGGEMVKVEYKCCEGSVPQLLKHDSELVVDNTQSEISLLCLGLENFFEDGKKKAETKEHDEEDLASIDLIVL